MRILIKLCKTRRTGKHHRDLSRQKQTLNKPKKPAVSPTQSDSFSYKLSFLEFVCLMRKSLCSGWQTSDGPITRCVEPSLFWHKMVLVENLRVDLSKNNAHYAQMFCPDMWLSMKASSLLCSTYIPSEYTHNVCQLHRIFIIFNSQFILAPHLSEDKIFSAEYVAQPLSSTSNSRKGIFLFHFKHKIGPLLPLNSN